MVEQISTETVKRAPENDPNMALLDLGDNSAFEEMMARHNAKFPEKEAKVEEANGIWINKSTALFKIEKEGIDDKVSVCFKVFANKQVLATVSDSERFGNTVTVKRVGKDPNEDGNLDQLMMMGAIPMRDFDDDDFDNESDEKD